MARRGRKRKGGPRESNGRAQRAVVLDHGTEELQARRRWLAQQGDPAKTAYPLGVLLTNGLIDDAQHNAGCRYGWLYAVVFGSRSYAAVAYDGVRRGRGQPWDDAWLADRERELFRIEAALPSRRHGDALVDLVVHEALPRWLLPTLPHSDDVRRARRLLEALDSLVSVFGYRVGSASPQRQQGDINTQRSGGGA